jgi:putative membrane protein insertion efficiency factor
MKRVLLLMIRGYQLVLSPVIGANCRHEPTCSRYSFEAIERFGALKGLWLTLKRVGKCHPWGTWGYDPVPEKAKKEKTQSDSDPS